MPNYPLKLQQLAASERLVPDQLLHNAAFDSVCPGICINPDCDYTATVETDCQKGYCENCRTHTVASALVLAGLY